MLASYIDSTNLKPDATTEDIRVLCERAAELKMAAVCINPSRVTMASQILLGSGVGICTVIGFPLGATLIKNKVNEAVRALDEGASELDAVINIGAVKDKELGVVENEVKQLLALKQDYNYILKIIVETALLSTDELKQLVILLGDLETDFIKTSTGFASRGAALEDIAIINEVKQPELKVKASGGIKTLDFALQLINIGVDRIGSSSAEQLVESYRDAHYERQI